MVTRYGPQSVVSANWLIVASNSYVQRSNEITTVVTLTQLKVEIEQSFKKEKKKKKYMDMLKNSKFAVYREGTINSLLYGMAIS